MKTMDDEFSLFRYAVEMSYIDQLNKLHWWQFGKRKKLDKWRERQLQKTLDSKN